jgi:uncharacterized surface protein with fasciclin (FAS1) repeats
MISLNRIQPFYFFGVHSLNKIIKMKKTFFAITIASVMAFVACDAKKDTEKTTDTSTTTPEVTPPPPPTDTTGGKTTTPAPTGPKTVVDIAMSSADHSTLVAAVKAADLATTLSGAGPFTVFAPTNAAFDKLPKGTVEGLLKPEKKKDLAGILTYHVVAGAIKAADLKDGQMVKTVNGKEFKVTIKDGKVSIGGANVVAADLIAGNGVVHVLDGVLMPK